MRLDDEKESSYVEDRRGSSTPSGGIGGFVGGASNIGRIMMFWPLIKPLLKTKFGWAIIAIGAFVYFGNPLGLLNGTKTSTSPTKADDKEAVFISKVLKTTEDVWDKLLPKYGLRYKKPHLVLFREPYNKCLWTRKVARLGPFLLSCRTKKGSILDLKLFG